MILDCEHIGTLTTHYDNRTIENQSSQYLGV